MIEFVDTVVRVRYAESKCSYRKPARYDDPLRIRTRVTSAKSRVITFGYEILHDETKDLLATGETIHVVCDSKGRPKPLPEKYRRYFDFGGAKSPSHKAEDNTWRRRPAGVFEFAPAGRKIAGKMPAPQ